MAYTDGFSCWNLNPLARLPSSWLHSESVAGESSAELPTQVAANRCFQQTACQREKPWGETRASIMDQSPMKLSGCQRFYERGFKYFWCNTEQSWTNKLSSTNTVWAVCHSVVCYIVRKIRNLGAPPSGSVCECARVPLQSSTLMSTHWSRTYLG